MSTHKIKRARGGVYNIIDPQNENIGLLVKRGDNGWEASTTAEDTCLGGGFSSRKAALAHFLWALEVQNKGLSQ